MEKGRGDGLKIDMTDEQKEIFLRPYFIAKECGCKFIFGSDAHSTKEHESYEKLTQIFADELELKEENIV